MRIDSSPASPALPARRAARLACALALGIALAAAALLAGCASGSSTEGASDGQAASEPAADSDYDPVANEYNIIAAGYAAPDFSFKTIDGATANLSDFKGKVVLLTFWASWCGYCMQDMPIINEVVGDNPDVAVVAINRGDSTSEAIDCAKGLGYDYTWGLDEDGAIQELYPARGIPYTITIGKDGMIVDALPGSLPDMKSYLEEVLVTAGA